MSITYNVSSLHRLAYDDSFEMGPSKGGEVTRVLEKIHGRRLDVRKFVMKDGQRVRTDGPSRQTTDVLAWREQFNKNHIGVLGEPVTWDENSDFMQIEDFPNHGDALLRYTSAVFAFGGDEADLTIPSDDYASVLGVLNAVREAPELPRFKQIIGCKDYWLPTQAHILIKDNNWRSFPQSFGSSYRLLDDLRDVAALIAAADPAVTSIASRCPKRGNTILEYAWMTCRIMSEFCAVAIEQHLPLSIGGR